VLIARRPVLTFFFLAVLPPGIGGAIMATMGGGGRPPRAGSVGPKAASCSRPMRTTTPSARLADENRCCWANFCSALPRSSPKASNLAPRRASCRAAQGGGGEGV
jgi:hypothetical protein